MTHIQGLVKCLQQKKITKTMEKSIISLNLQNFKLKLYNQCKNKYNISRGNPRLISTLSHFFALFFFTNLHLFFPIKYGHNSIL
jgi:hypothetical protein